MPTTTCIATNPERAIPINIANASGLVILQRSTYSLYGPDLIDQQRLVIVGIKTHLVIPTVALHLPDVSVTFCQLIATNDGGPVPSFGKCPHESFDGNEEDKGGEQEETNDPKPR